MRRKLHDEDMWMWWAAYARPSVAMGVNQGFAGKGKIIYPKNPIMRNMNAGEATETDKQRKREEFVMRMRSMKANWDLTHEKEAE